MSVGNATSSAQALLAQWSNGASKVAQAAQAGGSDFARALTLGHRRPGSSGPTAPSSAAAALSATNSSSPPSTDPISALLASASNAAATGFTSGATNGSDNQLLNILV